MAYPHLKHTLILLLGIWLASLTSAVQARPDDPPSYDTYLPLITKPIPLIEDRRAGPEVCMAWTPGVLVDRAKADFNAQFFFHSSSYQVQWEKLGGIPIWRTPNQPDNFTDVAAELRRQNYSRLLIAFNEPDIAGQDGPIDVADLASLYRLGIALFPGATFIVPNTNSVLYLRQFMTAVGDDWRRGRDIIGIHMYQPLTGYDETGYPQVDYPTIWPASWMQPVYDLAAQYDSQIWITEVGLSNKWRPADLERYTRELLQTNTQAICFYTPHCGGYSPHACWHNLYDTQASNANLTLTGITLQSLLEEYK